MENNLYSEYLKTIEEIGNILSEDEDLEVVDEQDEDLEVVDEEDELELPS